MWDSSCCIDWGVVSWIGLENGWGMSLVDGVVWDDWLTSTIASGLERITIETMEN